NWLQFDMFEIGIGSESSSPDGPRGPFRIASMLLISGGVRQSGPSPDLHLSCAMSKRHARGSHTTPSRAPSVMSHAAVTLASTIWSLAGESQAPGSRNICWMAWIIFIVPPPTIEDGAATRD